MELCWPKVGHTFKVSQHYQCVIYYCMFVLKSHVMEIKMIKTFHKGFINKNCKWLLCISHHELFIILLLKLPKKKSFLDCSIKSACSTAISSYCSSTSSMGHSPLSNDHCYFDHPCRCTVYSLPSHSLSRCSLPYCSLQFHWNWHPSRFQWNQLLLS